MARTTRTHIPDNLSGGARLAPKHLTKTEFAKRLYSLMLGKGWRQSDFARRAGLPRDSISSYMRATRLPTPSSLKKMATALGVKPEELLPNHVESAIDADTPAFEMKVSPNAPGFAWLRINRMATTSTCVKIAELLQADDDAANRK